MLPLGYGYGQAVDSVNVRFGLFSLALSLHWASVKILVSLCFK